MTMNCPGDHNVAHYLPAVYPANDGRVNTVSNTRIDISHALDNDGTTVEAGKRMLFDYTLISNTQGRGHTCTAQHLRWTHCSLSNATDS